MNYILDWKPSPPDERDFKFSNSFLQFDASILPATSIIDTLPEVYDQKELGSCHDPETSVLTNSGWKLFKDLTESDLLASVNPETAEVIYEKPTKIIELDYAGDMYIADNQNLNFAVTEDHKMLVRKWVESTRTLDTRYELVKVSDLGWYSGLLTSVIFKNETLSANPFILKGIEDNKRKKNREDLFLERSAWFKFLGIFIAEGTLVKTSRGACIIQIAAYKEREKSFIKQILSELNIHAYEQVDRFKITSIRVFKELEKYFWKVKAPFKRIPEYVFEEDFTMMTSILEGLFAGDGCLQGNTKSYYTSSVGLAEDIQRLLFLSGKVACVHIREPRNSTLKDGRTINGNYPEHHIIERYTSNVSVDKKEVVKIVPYVGKVFCAEVPTFHTLVTKRQGKILISGNCVFNSSGMATLYQSRLQNREIFPSRLFGYWNTRELEGTVNEDSGAYIRDAFKILNKVGTCKESTWPYNTDEFLTKPSEDCYTEALKTTATQYHRLNNSDILELKNCIATLKKPFVFGFTVYQSFMGSWESVMPIPRNGERVLGGHAVLAIGYSDAKKAFLIKNSWSKDWKDAGHFWMPYSFITGVDCDDFWVLEGLSTLVPEPIPIPEPVSKTTVDLKKVMLSGSDFTLMQKDVIVRMGLELGLGTTNALSRAKNLTILKAHLGL